MLIFEAWCNNAVAQLMAAGVGSGSVQRDLATPTVDDGLPLVNVFVSSDHGSNAAPKTGYADFHHTTTVVVEVTDKAASGAAVKALMFGHAEAIMQSLLTNWSWGSGLIEGFAGVRQNYLLQPDGAPFAGRCQVSLDVLHYSLWPAAAPADTFGRVVTTLPGGVHTNVAVPTT